MKVHPGRVLALTAHTQGDGPVVYWMNRDGRVVDNWAYLYAKELADEKEVPLLVVYNLEVGFLGGGRRQHVFKVAGLQEVEKKCIALNTPFFLVTDIEGVIDFASKHKVGVVVTDFFPLHTPRKWVAHVRKKLTCAFYGVDAHNIVPCWKASPKQEYAARTFRPKLHALLPEYLEEFPRPRKHAYSYSGTVPHIKWDRILADTSFRTKVPEVSWITPGYTAGMKALKKFIATRLSEYDQKRNDSTVRGQSDLSPYLHYGQISAQRIVLEVLKTYAEERNIQNTEPARLIKKVMHKDRNGSAEHGGAYESFLEELVVRRELSDNFCFYNSSYDSTEGFPDWARATLSAHEKDQREYVYTKKQFALAQTHDPLWNAAQTELIRTGKMHGYMRMYWGKKILEWTKSAEDAMKIAIYLNDTYELDGRDPNGYVGIAWSIGGVHDRPWFERTVFGTIRYMARSGCEKKFDVDTYIRTWS